jgi:hypothetical protein
MFVCLYSCMRSKLPLLGGLLLASAFGYLAGWRTPHQPPALEISQTPERAELELQARDGFVTGLAPANSTLSVGGSLQEPEKPFEVQFDQSLPIEWWGQSWSLTLSIPAELAQIEDQHEAPAEQVEQTESATGQFVASKSGTKYHPIDGCSFVDRIKPENKIYFDSAQQAQAAGLEPSSCIKK